MEIIVILILIGINAFFALSEIAFVSSRRESIEESQAQGSQRAALVLKMMDEPSRFFSSIQVGITLIGIISGAFGGLAVAGDVSEIIVKTGISAASSYTLSIVVTVGLITYFSIVLGELVPKTIALRNPEKIILIVIPIINFFSLITKPVVNFLTWSTKVIVRGFGFKYGSIDTSEDPLHEILGIAKSAAVKNKIDKEQAGIIMRATAIRNMAIGDIMVKRSDIKSLSAGMSFTDALVAAHVHHHTRYPLYDEAANEMVGYVNFKDIVNTLRINPSAKNLKGILRPMISCINTDSISAVLKKLIASHQHIALVRDGKGAIVGMVTMENILESIVGDIKDEYDILPEYIYKITENRFLVGGGITLHELRKKAGDSVPDRSQTLDSWVREIYKKVPKVDSTIRYNGIVLIIRKISRSRIYETILETVLSSNNGRESSS